MTKVKKYTEKVLVRLTKEKMLQLKVECKKLDMNEAVYGRKSIEKCLRKRCIKEE